MTLTENAVGVLREEILSGFLKPGERVHLGTAAERLEMSPIPIREALRILASEGLVQTLPQRGYRVREASLEDLTDTYMVRKVVDPWAVELAVPNLDEEDLQQLEQSHEEMMDRVAARDWIGSLPHHYAFHFGIYEKCGSPWLLRMVQILWENGERYQRIENVSIELKLKGAREHAGILEACRRGEAAEAAELTRKHLEGNELGAKKLLLSIESAAEARTD